MPMQPQADFDFMTATPLDGNAASVTSHRKLFGRASACKSDPTELAATQTAAWPWVRAGVASSLNYAPDRRQLRDAFFGQPMVMAQKRRCDPRVNEYTAQLRNCPVFLMSGGSANFLTGTNPRGAAAIACWCGQVSIILLPRF